MLKSFKKWNRARIQRRRIQRKAPEYQEWIRLNEFSAPKLKYGPRISIIMPVYRPDMPFFKAAVNSVLNQTYRNWELCITDDASNDADLSEQLHELTQDHRIKLHVRSVNGHISNASNDALAMSSGTWVCFLDQDDLLAPDALSWLVQAISTSPDIDLIYSDRDKVTEGDQRFDPYFKPALSMDLLLAQNYLCHFVALRKIIVDRIGGFRPGYEGAQDHDLFLRVIEHVGSTRVKHIPKILYSWRAHSGSTALSLGSKSYALSAGVRAVQDHMDRTCPGAMVHMDQNFGVIRVKYPLPEHLPLISIVIPTRDRVDLLKKCIDSLHAITSYRNFEIIIVDNGSIDPKTVGYLLRLEHDKQAMVLRSPGEFNFSRLNNLALPHVRGDFILLLNNDIEIIEPEWLTEMVRVACRPDVGCVGAKLLYPDGRIQHGGLVTGIGGVAGHVLRGMARNDGHYFNWLNVTHDVSAVTAACLLVATHLYRELGGLNELQLAVAFNDVDFCLRVRELGRRNIYVASAVLTHHESVSRGLDSAAESVRRWRSEAEYMKKRWHHTLNCDPFYNPNLSLQSDRFALAESTRA
jgi:glycosyltransferase involved in cell wall biosynthesis